MPPAVFEPTTPAIERAQTARPLRSVLYQCSCHYFLPVCQTSVPDSKLLHDRKVQFVFVCFQYGALLGQHFYIPINRKRYFIIHVRILFDSTCHFSEQFCPAIWSGTLFSEKVCVSGNEISSFFQHLLFHPDRTCSFSEILLFHYDTACYFREHLVISENTCSATLDMTYHFDVSSWYGILFQQIFFCVSFGMPFYFRKLSLMFL